MENIADLAINVVAVLIGAIIGAYSQLFLLKPQRERLISESAEATVRSSVEIIERYKQEVATLRETIDELNDKVNELQKRVAELEARNRELVENVHALTCVNTALRQSLKEALLMTGATMIDGGSGCQGVM